LDYLTNLFKGRINRRDYFFKSAGAYILLIVWVLIFGKDNPTSLQTTLLLLGYVVELPYVASLSVRRFHDLGKTGWYTLGLFIPVVNALIVLYLYFAKGEQKSNQFGAKL
jgi:uncharacterized membrane protein YhaH (DUF805 family)